MKHVTRRDFVLAGLGLLALPAVSFADGLSTKRQGVDAAGASIDGLLTINGKTYCYKGGKKQYGSVSCKGRRWFDKTSGEMLKNGLATWDDGTRHYYDASGVLKLGWAKLPQGYVYAEEADLHKGWLDTATLPNGNKGQKRYYCDSESGVAKTGWFSVGSKTYYAYPETCCIARSTSFVDPDYKDDYGSIYDFADDGAASWHLPVPADVACGAQAALPEQLGDHRQRLVRAALSRIGTPYGHDWEGWRNPAKLVCDELTSWAWWAAFGKTLSATSDMAFADMGVQYDYCASLGAGHICAREDLRPGDLVFEDASGFLGHRDYEAGVYHAAVYCGNGMVVEAQNSGRTDWQGRYTEAATYCTLEQSVAKWGFTCGAKPYAPVAEDHRRVSLPK